MLPRKPDSQSPAGMAFLGRHGDLIPVRQTVQLFQRGIGFLSRLLKRGVSTNRPPALCHYRTEIGGGGVQPGILHPDQVDVVRPIGIAGQPDDRLELAALPSVAFYSLEVRMVGSPRRQT